MFQTAKMPNTRSATTSTTISPSNFNLFARLNSINKQNDDDDEMDLLVSYMRHIAATIFSSVLVVITAVMFIDVVLHWSQGEIGILVGRPPV